MVDGCTPFAAVSVCTPSRSLITRSYCALLRRGTCDVMATPRVSQNVTPPPAAPVITTPEPPEPPTPLTTAFPAPPLPVVTAAPPPPGVPEEPPGTSPTFPTQPPIRVAAANT